MKSDKRQPLDIQKACVLKYSSSHATEVWVKYNFDDKEWKKFTVLKCVASVSLPVNLSKYDGLLPVKPRKAADLRKIVEKYVPQCFEVFYDTVLSVEDVDVASDTNEID